MNIVNGILSLKLGSRFKNRGRYRTNSAEKCKIQRAETFARGCRQMPRTKAERASEISNFLFCHFARQFFRLLLNLTAEYAMMISFFQRYKAIIIGNVVIAKRQGGMGVHGSSFASSAVNPPKKKRLKERDVW